MSDRLVVNASPLIILSRAGRLALLRGSGERVFVPAAVVAEVRSHSDEAALAIDHHNWLEPVEPEPVPEAVAAWDLGQGESAVLAWAITHPGSVAILDDFAARKCADVVGVRVRGTLGLVLAAKKADRIVEARPVVEELRRAGLYLSDAIIRQALELVGE